MAKIAFSLIKSDNLKKYGAFSIKQTETVVDVPGDLDSSTQQKLRDAIAPAFNRLRDELNDHISSMREKIEDALAKGQSQVQLKKALGKDIETRIGKIDELLKKAIPALVKRDKELVAKIETALDRLDVATAWTFGNLVWEGVETGQKLGQAVMEGVTGDWLSVAITTIRGCISIVKSINATIEAFENASSEEALLRKQINAKLKEIKKLKPTAKVPSGSIDEIERLLRTYPIRVAELQESAKPLAKQLDQLLDATEKVALPDSKRQKEIEKSVEKLINKVIHVNVYCESGLKLATSAKEAAEEAKKRRATDWNLVWNTLGELYDQYCTLEGKMEIKNELDFLKDYGKEQLEQWLKLEDDLES